MAKDKIGYLGFGSFLPSRTLTNQDLEQMVETSDEWIRQRTGIETRRIMDENETVLDMALQAAEKALKDADVSVDDIGDVRVAVNTWMRFPSLATQVQKDLGINSGSASDVAAGCAGFIYAVEDAYNKILAERTLYARRLTSLVIGVDGLSLVTNWTDRNTCVLLGDGAGAVVMGISDESEILATHTEAEGKYGDLLYSDPVLPHQLKEGKSLRFSHAEMGRRSYLHMDGTKVFPVAVRTMARNVREVLRKYNDMHPEDRIEVSQIDYIYPHQANLRIIAAVADSLDLPMERIYSEGVVKYGNTSAASIPIGYAETRHRTKDRVMVDVAVGSGFASGAILRRASGRRG